MDEVMTMRIERKMHDKLRGRACISPTSDKECLLTFEVIRRLRGVGD
jgi:hypothetical protein